MLKARSRISARTACVPFLMGPELTPLAAGFKAGVLAHQGHDLLSSHASKSMDAFRERFP
jgi:hypothetical protein